MSGGLWLGPVGSGWFWFDPVEVSCVQLDTTSPTFLGTKNALTKCLVLTFSV